MTSPNNHPPGGGEPAPADRDWFGGRRWTGIAAIGFLVVVLVAAVVVVVGRGGARPASPPAQPAAGRSFPSGAAATAVPTTAPAGVSWTIYQTVALPSAAGAGPAHVDGALATGYAHTPLGALLAAANDIYRFGLADDAQWRAVADATLAPGPGKDAWIKLRTGQPWTPPVTGDLTQIAGFEFASYTPSDAVIQLVTRDSKGTYQVGAQHVTWSGTDWLLVLPASGVGTTQITPSLAGFVAWGGV